MSSPTDFAEDAFPCASSTFMVTSQSALEPPDIDAKPYYFIRISEICPVIFWIAFSDASTGPTP